MARQIRRALPAGCLIGIKYSAFLLLVVAHSQTLSAKPGQARSDISQKPLELAYRVRIKTPTTHLAQIEIDARNVSTPALDS